MIILGGQLQIGDVIFRAGLHTILPSAGIDFGRAVVAGMHTDAIDVEIGEKLYSIGVDPQVHYRILRKDDHYQAVVFQTADWLMEIRNAGFPKPPSFPLDLLWSFFTDDEQDEILTDARRCLIASGAVRGAI
jgi:hypothetical protein